MREEKALAVSAKTNSKYHTCVKIEKSKYVVNVRFLYVHAVGGKVHVAISGDRKSHIKRSSKLVIVRHNCKGKSGARHS